MEKLKIGFNQVAKNRDKHFAEKKAEIFNHAIDFFKSHHLPIDKELMHKEGFKNYFLRLFAETYDKDFPSYMSSEQRVNMANVSIGILEQYDSQYRKLRCPFDVNTLSIPEDYDYGLYLTSPAQINTYNIVVELCDVLNRYAAETNKSLNNPVFGAAMRGVLKELEFNGETLCPSSNPSHYQNY